MKWPSEIIDAFTVAMDVNPLDPDGKSATIRRILDLVAREALYRAAQKGISLEDAYLMPITPLGAIVNRGVDGTKSIFINGLLWNDAVDQLYYFVRTHVDIILNGFAE